MLPGACQVHYTELMQAWLTASQGRVPAPAQPVLGVGCMPGRGELRRLLGASRLDQGFFLVPVTKPRAISFEEEAGSRLRRRRGLV